MRNSSPSSAASGLPELIQPSSAPAPKHSAASPGKKAARGVRSSSQMSRLSSLEGGPRLYGRAINPTDADSRAVCAGISRNQARITSRPARVIEIANFGPRRAKTAPRRPGGAEKGASQAARGRRLSIRGPGYLPFIINCAPAK